MSTHENRSAYVRSPWQFEVRDNPVGDPGPGELLVEIAACAVCGTDLDIVESLAEEWQVFGHEVAGIVRQTGEGVIRFSVGDRVALDSSAPCGECEICQPEPWGRGRPELCRTPATYWGSDAMGFGEMLVTPHECAVAVPDEMSLDVAALAEPLGVSLDLVQTAQVRPGDHVLVVGPGPLGLGAVALSKRAGAERVVLAGRSHSHARLETGDALGADEIVLVDQQPLADYDFGKRAPDRVLCTAPPAALPECIGLVAFGGTVAYIGIAWGPEAVIELDADDFHFRKLSLRASHASPGTHAAECVRLLREMPHLGEQLISHRFALDDIAGALETARDDRSSVKKMVMVSASQA